LGSARETLREFGQESFTQRCSAAILAASQRVGAAVRCQARQKAPSFGEELKLIGGEAMSAKSLAVYLVLSTVFIFAVLASRGVFLQHVLWGEQLSFYNSKPDWVDEPMLRETLSPEEIRLLGEVFLQRGNPEALAQSEALVSNIGRLKAAGGRLVVGTDTGGVNGGQYFGFGTHIELEMLVTKGGLTPMEAIVAVTRDAAQVLRLDRHGTIAAGKEADFIVLNANPLDDIANTRKIERVYLRGQEVPRAEHKARWQAGFGTAAK
jgi:imidazolonepropionase-like amidohydrolase